MSCPGPDHEKHPAESIELEQPLDGIVYLCTLFRRAIVESVTVSGMPTPPFISISSLFQKDPPAPPAVRLEPEPPGEPFVEWLPVYDLEAVACELGPSVAADCLGWVRVPQGMRGDDRCFVAQVFGRAMEPLIPDGAYCMFRIAGAGSHHCKILLLQHHAIWDPDTGGTYTVARYEAVSESAPSSEPASGNEPTSHHTWHHTSIRLVPSNPAFATISLSPDQVEDLRIIAEFLRVIG